MRQLLHRLYFITKCCNMIVIFTGVLLALRADKARSKKALCRAHRSCPGRGREEKCLALCGQEADQRAHLIEMLLAEKTVELVQDEHLYPCELQLAEAVQFQNARC